MPPKIINKIENFGQDFRSMTLSTVNGFWLIVKNLIFFIRIGCGGRI